MKKWLMVLAAVAFSIGAFAGEGWLTDFDKAKAEAKEKNRPILIDFSGSDWCGWCIKLDKEVFQKDEFKAYADDNLVLMLADFPSDKSKQSADVIKQNEKLAKEFGVRGFPTVFVLGADGEIIGKTGYQKGGPEAYVTHIKKIIADGKTK
jgi:thioredoxin-related protein